MSVIEKVRKWIDGDSAEGVLEDAARDAQVTPRSKAEEFIVTLARSVEEVMQAELVPLPQGTTIIPSEYIIFLSEQDDKEWQGAKRRGLEQGLFHILAERAKEIAGKKKLETKNFVIELRVDGTLEKGDVRVQHSWDDPSAGKTGVMPRQKVDAAIRTAQASMPPPRTPAPVPPTTTPPAGEVPPRVPNTDPAFRRATPDTSPNLPDVRREIPATIAQTNISRVEPLVAGPGEEGEVMTNVRRRARELYRLEIWLNNVRQSVLPIYQNEVVVGRGSSSRPVDITLAGDPEISRRHLSIITDGTGKFWVVNEGRNPAAINNIDLPPNQRVAVIPGEPLIVCSYTLRIQNL